jgi:hypothetical protein
VSTGSSEPSSPNAVPVEALRTILVSQYHAALAMLRRAIEQCPDELWTDGRYTNPFWRIVYHTIYYAHLYSQPRAEAFRAWEGHQTDIQNLDDIPAPPDIKALVEPPHRPPQTGEPYSKAEMLDYLEYVDGMLDAAIGTLDLTSAESGFSWYRVSKLEHQFVSVRHIQHHTAQLADRVRAATGNGVGWVSARARKG